MSDDSRIHVGKGACSGVGREWRTVGNTRTISAGSGGQPSEANVLAAVEVARLLGAGAQVVTLMVDPGLKYLGTDVYRGR